MADIASRRLRAHRLVGRRFATPVDAVRAFGAVQSQDYPASIWGLGQRSDGATARGIGELFDEGAILRTHILRPTWHFVLPEDVGWMFELTAPTLRRGLGGRWRRLDIDARTIDRAEAAFARAVAERPRTRPELGAALRSARIDPEGQRLPHLILAAELDRVLISGPRRGREFTYAAFASRARPARDFDRPAALGELATRFFKGHGPAQLADLVWWSGITMADARTGIAAAGEALGRESIDRKDHWFDPAVGAGSRSTRSNGAPRAHLLPNFDEYTVGYRDRSALLDPDRHFDPSIFSFGSVLANVVAIDGLVRGTWRREERRGELRLQITLLDRLTDAESEAVDTAVAEMGRFLERDVRAATEVKPSS